MSIELWVTLCCAWILGLIMVFFALISRRSPHVRTQFLRLYELGARRPLQVDVATRSAAATTLGSGLGLIISSFLILLPWSRGLLFFPPIWIPVFGSVIGYGLGWRTAQVHALAQARARGEFGVDLAVRHPRRYVPLPYLFMPWLLIIVWTVILVFLLQPTIGSPLVSSHRGPAETVMLLNWYDVLLAPGVGLFLALGGWFLLKYAALVPRSLPSHEVEFAAQTEEILRQEALTHIHIGCLGSCALLFMGPTSLISNAVLRFVLSAFLILVTLGLCSAPTLFQRALGGFRQKQEGEGKGR